MMLYFHDDIYLQAQSQVYLSAVISYALRDEVPVKWIGRESIHAYICLHVLYIMLYYVLCYTIYFVTLYIILCITYYI